jgi:hypothetical protein
MSVDLNADYIVQSYMGLLGRIAKCGPLHTVPKMLEDPVLRLTICEAFLFLF